MRWISTLILSSFLVMVFDWWQSRSLRKGSLPPSIRSTNFETLDGDAALPWSNGRYTMVYVFAPWCGICKFSASNLNSFADNMNVVSLVFNWQTHEEVQEFVRNTGLNTPVLLGADNHAKELGVESFPSYLLVNPRGEVIRAWTGYTSTLGLYIKLAALRIVTVGEV